MDKLHLKDLKFTSICLKVNWTLNVHKAHML